MARSTICILGLAALSTSAPACVCVFGAGAFAAVTVERALLIWDDKHHIEYFARDIQFECSGKDFGFLIPTPSVPEITDIDAKIFPRLARLLARSFAQENPLLDSAESKGAEVLATQRVGNLIAVTLKADSGRQLTSWMKANDYTLTSDISSWAQPYLKKGWPVTALKIDASSPEVTPKALMFKFQTDRLFYPYNGYQTGTGKDVPARQLALMVLAQSKILAGKGSESDLSWSKERYRTTLTLDASERSALASALKIDVSALEGLDRLTGFEDYTDADQRTADLFFALTPTPGETVRRIFSQYWPYAGLLIVAVIPFYFVRRRSRRSGLQPI